MKFLDLKYEAFGMDINDSSLKIIKLEKKKKDFFVDSFFQTKIDSGLIEGGIIKDENKLAEVISSSYNNVKGKKLKTKYVVASLPEEESFLQVVQMPKMSEKELSSAIMFEAENHIPMPIDQVYLDFQIIPPIVDGIDHLDVLVVATPKKIVDSYVSCIKSANLIPIAFEVESQSIVRALVKNETSEYPLVLINLGASNTDFIVFSGNSIRFTHLMPAFKNPLSEEFSEQIKKYINFYQQHASHEHLAMPSQIKKIILCGGGAGLAGLCDFLHEKLSVDTQVCDPFSNLLIHKDHKVNNSDFLPFVTALGLAIRGINVEKEKLD